MWDFFGCNSLVVVVVVFFILIAVVGSANRLAMRKAFLWWSLCLCLAMAFAVWLAYLEGLCVVVKVFMSCVTTQLLGPNLVNTVTATTLNANNIILLVLM